MKFTEEELLELASALDKVQFRYDKEELGGDYTHYLELRSKIWLMIEELRKEK